MKLLTRLSSIFDRILDFFIILSGILLMFSMLSVTAEVFLRYVFNRPLGWVEEISGYILLYITFLVSAWVLKGDGHIILNTVISQLNSRAQALTNSITSALSAIVFFVLTWYGAKVTVNLFQTNYFTDTVLQLPKFIIIAVIFVGSFLLFIQFGRRAYGYLRSLKAPSDEGQKGSGIIKSEL